MRPRGARVYATTTGVKVENKETGEKELCNVVESTDGDKEDLSDAEVKRSCTQSTTMQCLSLIHI